MVQKFIFPTSFKSFINIKIFGWYAHGNHSCLKHAKMSVKNDTSGGVE